MARLKYYNTETEKWEYADSASTTYPLVNAEAQLKPEHYHVFGEVDSLSVTLVEIEDGKVHEYCFEFIPSGNFTGLTINPEPRWVAEPDIRKGKTHQVSILRGIGVMVCA